MSSHKRQRPSQPAATAPTRTLQVEVGGRLLTGNELQRYAKKRGLCQICAKYQTHKRVGFLRPKLEPLTIHDKDGKITVYKGYCIQPTCYQSVNQVKVLLGERVTRLSTTKAVPPGLVGCSSSSSERSTDDQAPAPPQHERSPQYHRSPPQHHEARHHSNHAERRYNSQRDLQHHDNYEQPIRNQQQFGARLRPQETRADRLQHTPPRVRYGESEIPQQFVSRTGPLPPRTTYKTNRSAPEPPGGGEGGGFRESGRTGVGTDLQLSLQSRPGHASMAGIQRLECLAKDANFVDFFVRLEAEGATADVVIQAFRVLREQLVKHQAARPTGVILSGGGWVKTIDDKITDFKTDRDVVLEGLRALMTICEQPYNYRVSVVRKGAVDVILAMMEEYNNDDEVILLSCSILDVLSKNARDKLNASHSKAVSVIRKMVQVVLQRSDIPSKTRALSTLYNLSKQKAKCETTGKNLLHSVHQALSPAGDGFADATAAVLSQDGLSEELAGAIVSLVWKVSCGYEENQEGNPRLATEKLVNALVVTVQRFDTRVIVEASCGAFANLPLKPSFSVMQTQAALEAVCEAAQKPSGTGDPRLALCSVHAICNLLSDATRRDAAMYSYQRACRLVLELIETFPDSPELIELGCSVVGHLAYDNRRTQEMIISEGRFGVILQEFRNMAADREAVTLEKKEAILSALLAWSGCEAGVRQIKQGRALDAVGVLLRVEADPSLLNMLEIISANCQQNHGRNQATYTDILRAQPHMFAVLMQDVQSDDSAVLLVSALRESGAMDRRRLDGKTFEVLISTLSRFRTSERAQSAICVLLTEAIQRGHEDWRAICRSGLPIVSDALCRHGDSADVAEHGCYLVLCILRHCDLRQLASVRTALAGALVSIMGGQDGARAAAASMNVFVECIQHDSYFLETGTHPSTIRAAVSAMNLHLESAELHRTGCHFLRMLCSDDRAKEVIGREGGVTTVMTSMVVHGQSPQVCAAALGAIRRLSMVPANKALIAQNGGIDALLERIQPQMENPEIVSITFSALNNIAAEPETRSVAEVGEGVIVLLNDSMSRFPNEREVQKNACFLLRSCSYRSSNLRLMKRYNPTLIPLLTRAAQVFPEDCRVIAVGVVNRLRAG